MVRKLMICCLILAFAASVAQAAKEIQFNFSTSNTIYALVRLPSTGKVWDVTNTNWATWDDDDIGDYDIPLADQSGDYYTVNFPAGITTAGVYAISIREESGAAPAATDLIIGVGSIEWDGTAERTLAAVQLADDGFDNIATTAPTGVASDFREMIVQVWRRFFAKTILTTTSLTTYADDGSTVLTTQSVGETSTSQTMGAAE